MSEEYKYVRAGAHGSIELGKRSIVKEALVQAPLPDVWRVWTTEAGARKFFAPACKIELAVGGAYEMLFDLEAPEGSRGGEGLKILSFSPEKMLSFEWNAPPHIPEVRKERTWVVLFFDEIPDRRVKVTLNHYGWREGAEWDKAYQYFDRAWGLVMSRLEESFTKGPIDWSKL